MSSMTRRLSRPTARTRSSAPGKSGIPVSGRNSIRMVRPRRAALLRHPAEHIGHLVEGHRVSFEVDHVHGRCPETLGHVEAALFGDPARRARKWAGEPIDVADGDAGVIALPAELGQLHAGAFEQERRGRERMRSPHGQPPRSARATWPAARSCSRARGPSPVTRSERPSARRIERGPSRGSRPARRRTRASPAVLRSPTRQISWAHEVMAVSWGSPGGGVKSNCARVPSTRWRTTRTSAVFSMAPSDPVTVMRGGREIGAANDVSMEAVAPDCELRPGAEGVFGVALCRWPSASGRSAMVTHVRAPPAVTSPISHRIMSMTWVPNAPIHPPPRPRSKSQPYWRSGDPRARGEGGEMKVLEAADLARGDELPHLSPGRLMAELEVEEVDHPGRLGLGDERRTLVGGHAERLVAQHGMPGRRWPVARTRRGGTAASARRSDRRPPRTGRAQQPGSLAETTSTTSHPICRKTGATTRDPKPAPTMPTRSGRRSPVVDPDVSMVPPLAVPGHPTSGIVGRSGGRTRVGGRRP